jgi:hypothetical protein
MAKDQQNSSGGPAVHAGTNYQNRVAALSAVQILAEQDATPSWDLPAAVTLNSMQAEARSPVDDLAVQTSAGGAVRSQAKHVLSLETETDSQLGSAISQFVREYRGAKPPRRLRRKRRRISASTPEREKEYTGFRRKLTCGNFA